MPSGPKKRRAAKKKTNVNSRKGIDLHHEENDHILSALVEEDEDLVLIATDVVELSEPVVAHSSKGDVVVVDKVVSEDALEFGSNDNVGKESINDVVDSSLKEDNSNEPTEEVSDSNSNNEIDPHLSSKDVRELGSKENEGNKFIEDVVNSSVGEDKCKESSQEVLDTGLNNETDPRYGSSRPMLVRALLCPSFLYASCCYDTQLSKTYKLKGSILEGCCQCQSHENRDLDNQGLDVPFGAWHENKRRGGQAPEFIFRATPPEEQGMTR